MLFKKYGHVKTRIDTLNTFQPGSWRCKKPQDIIRDIDSAMEVMKRGSGTPSIFLPLKDFKRISKEVKWV